MPTTPSCVSCFHPDALDLPLAALDHLPRNLWLQGIINSVGILPQRLDGLYLLRESLLAGALPPWQEWRWPIGAVLTPFVEVLVALDLAVYCAGNPDVTDQLLRSLLWHTDRIIEYRHESDEARAIERAVAAFHEDWRERVGAMDELIYVFGDVADALKSARWDATRGLLKSEGWQEMLRIRRLLEHLPELRELIRRLGREHPSEELGTGWQLALPQPALTPRQVAQAREVRVPELPGDVCGIERSGDIARMLAAEAVLLRHPTLRLIWFARHAERILLTYRDRAVSQERVMAESPVERHACWPQPEPRLELGPLIVCVDTSGSMQGAAEHVAKALVLEALRSAGRQRRRCYAYGFSGPGEIIEYALGVDGEGMERAVEFLRQSFHGGTDVSEPLERALLRIGDARWQSADLLIASDGEFGATAAVAAQVRRARADYGLRVQGVLIGDRETIGLLELCDDIFWVKDWRRFGTGAESPVHSKSLTSIYFPNALR